MSTNRKRQRVATFTQPKNECGCLRKKKKPFHILAVDSEFLCDRVSPYRGTDVAIHNSLSQAGEFFTFVDSKKLRDFEKGDIFVFTNKNQRIV